MGDQALLEATIAGAGSSPKLPPDQVDECIKHPCLFRSTRQRCQLAIPHRGLKAAEPVQAHGTAAHPTLKFPPLHLTRPGQLPAPRTGDDSHAIMTEAIDSLARLRTAYWLDASAIHLHALASLIAEADRLLPAAGRDAPGQELTWTQIGELLSTTATTAARRYRNKP